MNMRKLVKRSMRPVLDKFLDEQPKLLVVGSPRSGFTLLISIISKLLGHKRFRSNPLRRELQSFIPQASEDVYKAIEEYFRKHINLDDLIVSPEFKLLVGGPKWLSKENSNVACVRKYIGIRNRGDFLAVYYLPKFIMDFDQIIHSHYQPDRWLEEPHYRDYLKFSSMRNPLDTLNSSVFSINALTGQYIDRYVNEDPDAIREKLALYKLSDLKFFEGLIKPLLRYLKVFIKVKDKYSIMRWEDLITEPEKTILAIAKNVGISISPDVAKEMWENMKYRNLTRYHRFNFRKGIVGDWKNNLVNEHLEIIKSYGFDEFLEAFGYEKIKLLDKKDYTPFQKTVEEHIQKGQPYEYTGDQNIFTFAFNKSNIDASKFDFVSYKGKGAVEIERSSIKDEAFFKGFMDAVDKALGPVIESLNNVYEKYSS